MVKRITRGTILSEDEYLKLDEAMPAATSESEWVQRAFGIG